MQTGTKEFIKQTFGYLKTKEVFASDAITGLTAALEALEEQPSPELGEDQTGPDPDDIKAYLEDALVFLGNANFRLNSWLQKRLAEYLTDAGKRILKEDIPTDKHLFPDRFHEVVQSEQDQC